MTTPPSPRGRPQAASREFLQEAAFELFLENGFAGTTVEQITTRAGVSRNTFFNYFTAKGDVFWVELDDSLPVVSTSLRESAAEIPPMRVVLDALLALGREFGPGRVPFALTQYELIATIFPDTSESPAVLFIVQDDDGAGS